MIVICQQCKKKTLDKKDAVRIDDKNFHKECAQTYLDKKELVETICRIFKLKSPGPKNNAFIDKFHNSGMTYKGMALTLKYVFDIKKSDKSKANDGIGIIPYRYEEAKAYYQRITQGEKMAEQALEKNKEERERNKDAVRLVKMPEPSPITIRTENYTKQDIEW